MAYMFLYLYNNLKIYFTLMIRTTLPLSEFSVGYNYLISWYIYSKC